MSGISKIGIFSKIVHWHVTQNGALNYGMLLKTFFYVIHSYIPIINSTNNNNASEVDNYQEKIIV